jgi:L-fuconolactonase
MPSATWPHCRTWHAKLSGIPSDRLDADALRPYYDTVLAAFGLDRPLFGSDWPVCTLAAPYRPVFDLYQTLTAQVSAAEQQAIFDRTARRIYQLPEAGP